MNVYLKVEDGIELIGHTSLAQEAGEYFVDLPILGGNEALRLVYELEAVPVLTPDMKLGTECAVMLSLGQTPDFLPDWQRADEEQGRGVSSR